jgi:hypothetical protein
MRQIVAMKIIDLGQLQVASSASVHYEPSLELTEVEREVISALTKVGCTRFQAVDALLGARAAGAGEFGSLVSRAIQSVRSNILTLPNGVPVLADCNLDSSEPIEVQKGFWVFQRKCYQVEDAELVPSAEIVLRIKHAALHVALKAKRDLKRMQEEVEAFTNIDRLPSPGASREHIPRSVRLFVWQRDRGHCVQCGSNVRLEFDHIIPVVKGGSGTERNLRLLCEKCNRAKGKNI